MRVLLAVDGSPAAESARRLVRSLAWPHGTVIDVVSAPETSTDVGGAGAFGFASSNPSHDARHPLRGVLEDAVVGLEAPGRIVTRALLDGRPASAIVDHATESRAELVVIGSRGLGPIRSMVLGSVSAEVADHAPCPVLVVRRSGVERVLLAVDGSHSAQAATTFLAGCRALDPYPVEVLSVALAPPPPPPVPAPGLSHAAFEAYDAAIRANRNRAEVTAARAAAALREDGRAARWSISQGDPAHEILEAVRGFGTSLVVLGSRGHSGLKRVLLGSVARNVLLHTEASVLIVREPIRARSRSREREAVTGSARAQQPLSLGAAATP
jgi:nucleotide-binding universal stress UspA family protein